MALDNKRGVFLVLLEMSGPFDSVGHTLLLVCIKITGITDVAHQWFESYLSSITQTVCLGQTQINPLNLLHGSPQGSVLDLGLFVLYMGPIGGTILTSISLLTILNCMFHLRSRREGREGGREVGR